MKKELIAYIKASLRRTWGRSFQRKNALEAARVERGKYKCANCNNVFKRGMIEVDHITAVGRFANFDLYIERLFCDAKTGLQVLCIKCHSSKTKKDKKLFKK